MNSQFEELFKARKEEQKPEKSAPKKREGSSKKLSPTLPPVVKKSNSITTAKSKSLEFEQTLIYLKKNTKKEVKKTLLDDPSGQDFSDLVEQLLSNYLQNKK